MHLTTYSVSDSVSCIASEERNSGPGNEASSGTDNNFSANDSSLATATLGAKNMNIQCVYIRQKDNLEF